MSEAVPAQVVKLLGDLVKCEMRLGKKCVKKLMDLVSKTTAKSLLFVIFSRKRSLHHPRARVLTLSAHCRAQLRVHVHGDPVPALPAKERWPRTQDHKGTYTDTLGFGTTHDFCASTHAIDEAQPRIELSENDRQQVGGVSRGQRSEPEGEMTTH